MGMYRNLCLPDTIRRIVLEISRNSRVFYIPPVFNARVQRAAVGVLARSIPVRKLESLGLPGILVTT